jgi:hypothetical protein
MCTTVSIYQTARCHIPDDLQTPQAHFYIDTSSFLKLHSFDDAFCTPYVTQTGMWQQSWPIWRFQNKHWATRRSLCYKWTPNTYNCQPLTRDATQYCTATPKATCHCSWCWTPVNLCYAVLCLLYVVSSTTFMFSTPLTIPNIKLIK